MTTEADVFRAEHDAGEAVARWRDLERALVAVEARVDGRSGAGGEGERGVRVMAPSSTAQSRG